MTRSVARVVALAVLLLGVMASPAHAADELGLSPDGQTWSGQLSGPLFDPTVRWVPGDARRAQFYVRNQAADSGTLTIAVLSRDLDRLLRDDHLQLSARVGSDAWVDLAPGGQAVRLNAAALPAEAVRKVEVRARFDFASGNRTQRDAVAMDFKVTLSGADSTPVPDPNDPDGTPDPKDDTDLPDTGAPPVGWLLVAAGAAIGFGLALMKRRRREEPGHDAAH